ncbi:MAG: hypothetical protein ABL929_02975 [Ferruginibacter sp.]|nr:hypothetical protein [Ferruginibacter sp.]
MKYLYIILLSIFFSKITFAFSDTTNIPLGRQSRHDDIKKEISLCDLLDKKQDAFLKVGNNDAVNTQVTDALYRIPNELRQWIEKNDTQLVSNNDKVRYLKYVADVLLMYRISVKEKNLKLVDLPELLQMFEKAIFAKAANQTIIPFLQESNYGIAKILNQIFSEASTKNIGDGIVYLKYTTLYPSKILESIASFAQEPFADSLIQLACKNDPVKMYSFAQSKNSIVGKLIHRNNNNMVKQIALLSQTPNALFYFPFLDDIMHEKQSIESIQKYVGDGENGYDSVGYYKLLVQTAIAYSKRMGKPFFDTAIAYNGTNGLLETLAKKAKQHFVDQINMLHDQANLAIRMKAIQPLAPADIYYMMVMCESDIYTSSYKHSFARLLQLMGTKPRGDSLLLSVNFDHFRKFIKMAANYNKLDTFLKTMPATRSELIMDSFVANLDKSNLEDAVDVADSYTSITNAILLKSMLQNVIKFETKSNSEKNKKGIVIYGLLKTIFLSLKDSTINLTKEIGIPPIYDVANKYMQNEKGGIIEQVFFYGDKDGKTFYPAFRNSFAPKDWKVTDKKEWMEAVSIKGNVLVFANKPLDNDANLDDTAQIHLANYLIEKGLKPNMIVHRGHSYWLPRTMDRMPGDAKIVLLGSCGGYQNLNKILEINPDAHIISTKEIGAGDINRPILTYMNQVFATGADLNWKKMWQSLSKSFTTDPSKAVRDSWESYVPPYKNLGAIFLKAYAKKMEQE